MILFLCSILSSKDFVSVEDLSSKKLKPLSLMILYNDLFVIFGLFLSVPKEKRIRSDGQSETSPEKKKVRNFQLI